MKHGKCPFQHKGPLITLPDGRGMLCKCGGAALYDGDRLVGPEALVEGLDRLCSALETPEMNDFTGSIERSPFLGVGRWVKIDSGLESA